MAFDDQLYSMYLLASDVARQTARGNGAPVAILQRDSDSVYAVCEEPPDDMEPSPLEQGWTVVGIVEPEITA